MKASELIEKIHNGEIKSGTKIICHKKNEHFDYKVTNWFMGNWFSKVPPELHTSSSDCDKDMILRLCDESVTYEIANEIEKLNKKHFHNRQRQLANKINEIIDYLLEKESDK